MAVYIGVMEMRLNFYSSAEIMFNLNWWSGVLERTMFHICVYVWELDEKNNKKICLNKG